MSYKLTEFAVNQDDIGCIVIVAKYTHLTFRSFVAKVGAKS